MNKFFTAIVCVILFAFASGCAGMKTAMEYKDLEVKATSSNIFLENAPGKGALKVALQLRDGSGKRLDADLARQVEAKLKEHGHSVVAQAKEADYIVQLQVEVQDNALSARQVQGDHNSETGSGVVGGLAGASIGAISGRSPGAALAGAIIGGVGGAVADMTVNSMVKVRTFELKAVGQILEKSEESVVTKTVADIRQGQGVGNLSQSQSWEARSDYRKYPIEARATAKKVGLAWEDCKDQVVLELAADIAKYF